MERTSDNIHSIPLVSQDFKWFKRIEFVAEELKCPICLGLFSDPRIIGLCGHTFCMKCILGIHRDSTHNLKCPVCTQGYCVPSFSTEDLPKNFVIIAVCDKMHEWCKEFDNDASPTCKNETKKYKGKYKNKLRAKKTNNENSNSNNQSTQRNNQKNQTKHRPKNVNNNTHNRNHTDNIEHEGSSDDGYTYDMFGATTSNSLRCIECKKDLPHKNSKQCAQSKCYKCCTIKTCRGHNLCVSCNWFASNRCLSRKCQQCCTDEFCPAHSKNRINRCARVECNNSPSDLCGNKMCGKCCPMYGNHPCQVHTRNCKQCKVHELDPNCTDRLCSMCCSDRWCSVHGKGVLCTECIRTAGRGCTMCAECCERITCDLHRRAGLAREERSKCILCSSKSTSGCSQLRCRLCCSDQQCQVHSSLYLCHRCDNSATQGCTIGMCVNCCDDSNCIVHPILECCYCKRIPSDKGCVRKCCGNCCLDRQCPIHKDTHLWCNACNARKYSKRCSALLCQNCCQNVSCPKHGEVTVQKFVTNYKERTKWEHKIRKCVNKNNEVSNYHEFFTIYPKDPYYGQCDWCKFNSFKYVHKCRFCWKLFCTHCTLKAQ